MLHAWPAGRDDDKPKVEPGGSAKAGMIDKTRHASNGRGVFWTLRRARAFFQRLFPGFEAVFGEDVVGNALAASPPCA